jgi:hypothetical protein
LSTMSWILNGFSDFPVMKCIIYSCFRASSELLNKLIFGNLSTGI